MSTPEIGRVLELLEEMNGKLDRVITLLDDSSLFDQSENPEQMSTMKKVLRDHMLGVIENYKKMQEDKKK